MMSEERLCAFGAAELRREVKNGCLQFGGRLISAGEVRNVLDRPAGMVVPAEAL